MTNYERGILVGYAIVLFFFLSFQRKFLNYGFSAKGIILVIVLFFVSAITIDLIRRALKLRPGNFRKPALAKFKLYVIPYALEIALAEELIFRGIIQNFLSLWLGSVWALFLATIIFAAAHLPNEAGGWAPRHWNWNFAGLASGGGIVFGLAYIWTGTLFAPTLLHFLILIYLYWRRQVES